jgi:hypothetical protein
MQLSIEYIAGYFDADGSVFAYFGQQANRTWRPWVKVEAQFAGQNFEMLELIRTSLDCGGTIGAWRNNTGSGAYRLGFTRPETLAVLTKLEPHVRLKHEQVLLGLALAKTINPRRGGKGVAKITDAEQAFREQTVARISALNKNDGQVFRTKWVNSVEPSMAPDVAVETMPSQAATGTESHLTVLWKV